MQLYQNGKALSGKVLTLNKGNNWTAKFTGLNKYENKGKLIKYEIKEVNTPAGYVSNITGGNPAEGGFTITNTYQTTKVTVTKTWVDDNDRDGKRPTSIEVTLSATNNKDFKEQTAKLTSPNWTHTFENLPKYNNEGKAVTYEIKEKNVPNGYKVEYTRTKK